jgi:hypothetical protein
MAHWLIYAFKMFSLARDVCLRLNCRPANRGSAAREWKGSCDAIHTRLAIHA